MWFIDPVHLNPLGARLVAERLFTQQPRTVAGGEQSTGLENHLVEKEEAAVVKGLLTRLGIAGSSSEFSWERKLWWDAPMIVALLMWRDHVFARARRIAPFIYTLF